LERKERVETRPESRAQMPKGSFTQSHVEAILGGGLSGEERKETGGEKSCIAKNVLFWIGGDRKKSPLYRRGSAIRRGGKFVVCLSPIKKACNNGKSTGGNLPP